VQFDVFTTEQARAKWSFNDSTHAFVYKVLKTKFHHSHVYASLQVPNGWGLTLDPMYASSDACPSQWFTGFQCDPQLSTSDVNYFKLLMVEMGRLYLNDPIWKQYDVMLGSSGSAGDAYQRSWEYFENWIKPAKTILVDDYNAAPACHPSGAAVVGTSLVLTSLPFKDHLNFPIGTVIQKAMMDRVVFPSDQDIEKTLSGRQRCPFHLLRLLNRRHCRRPDLHLGADCGLPREFAHSNYTPPYTMKDRIPDKALLGNWTELRHVACNELCPYVISFCRHKGISCGGP
jgi:hypothetical protein